MGVNAVEVISMPPGCTRDLGDRPLGAAFCRNRISLTTFEEVTHLARQEDWCGA
jgi:hypothetical protein